MKPRVHDAAELAELVGPLVRVYRNIRRRCYSVQVQNEKGTWKVRAHCARVFMRDAVFLVSKAGRARVLKKKRKNVHAYVMGTITPRQVREGFLHVQVMYNPYLYETFMRQLELHEPGASPLAPIHKAALVCLSQTGVRAMLSHDLAKVVVDACR